jgi:serine protease Do/serine protease DegQ
MRICAFLLFAMLAGARGAAAESMEGRIAAPLPSIAPIVKQVMPAVVVVTSVRPPRKTAPIEPGDGFPSPPSPQTISGSGVIVDADRGLLVTAGHLVAKAEKVTVRLFSGRQTTAKVVATSPDDDLAVLGIEPIGLVALKLNQEDDLQVGDFVVAIGDPLDGGSSATFGIASGLRRSAPGIQNAELIATDLLIAQGSSGGPLLNLRGELVGINAIRLGSGFAFAVPVAAVRRLLASVQLNG